MDNNISKFRRPEIDYKAVTNSTFQARYIKALERVICAPMTKRVDCAQDIAEQIIHLADFRSITFLLMFHDRNELEVVEALAFSHLENGRKTSRSRIRRYGQDIGRIISLDFEPENASAITAKSKKIFAINRGDNAPKGFTRAELATLKDRAVYFVPLIIEDEIEAVFATGSPADDFEDTSRVMYELENFFICCAAKLRNARVFEERALNRVFVEKLEMPNLSLQEKKILQLMGSECTDKDICHLLDIKRSSLTTYKNRIADKTGCKTKIKMIKLAFRLGLVPLE